MSTGVWEPLTLYTNTDHEYTISCDSFLRSGGDGFSVLVDKAIDPSDFGPSVDSVRPNLHACSLLLS